MENIFSLIAELYLIFHRAFSEHEDFWWQLALEEKNHAGLIKTAKQHYPPTTTFPFGLISSDLEKLKYVNTKIASLVKKYHSNPPSEEEAFNVALELEKSAGEIHYQTFMDKEIDVTLINKWQYYEINKVFKTLNRNDKDHADRILTYMNNHGIKIRKTNI
jgi:hypothetical protein